MSDSRGVFAKRQDQRPEADMHAVTVQPHACAIAVDDDWKICAASDTCADVLGREVAALLGSPMGGVFPGETAHTLREQVGTLTPADPVGRVVNCTMSDGTRLDVTATRIRREVVFEFEPAAVAVLPGDGDRIRRLAQRVTELPDLAEAAEDAARALAALTGYDRVSVHRVGRSGLEGPLGLAAAHPLPGPPGRGLLAALARDFQPNLHVIPDVAGVASSGVPVTAGERGRGEARGLSNAVPTNELASALQRDRVRATVTMPVRIAGELWGVFLCHHGSPTTLSVGDRDALAQFAHLFGDGLERMEQRRGAAARVKARMLRDTLGGEVDLDPDLAAALREHGANIAALLRHDGWALWHDGRYDAEGHAPSRDAFEDIFASLKGRVERAAVPFERLGDLLSRPRGLDPEMTALMALPLSQVHGDCLLLFRRLVRGDDRLRVWERWEVEAAEALRGALVDVQQRISETVREARMRTQERQNVLIAELNHRMRNTLNLVLGFVSQGPARTASVAEFANALEARIVVLARALDDLTVHDWGRVGIGRLLDRKLGRYLGGAGPKVSISGDPIDLSPAAFLTMALVLHELVSNARKFGALSSKSGRVAVEMSLDETGFAHLVWTESGGPPVLRPRHAGYGLTLIERSVPYELRGKVDLDFAPSGLVARFALPPGHFTRIRPDAGRDKTAGADLPAVPDDISIDGAALVLDDSFIIALESEELLRAAGASKVYACNSVEAAMDALDRGAVTFALLDVNLGSETSLAVAEQLWSDGIPAVLATGYGANEDLLNDFPALPVLTKPYTVAEIKDVLRHFRDRRSG